MARGINKVILVGNLGQDPETRAMPDGRAVANISVATSKSWKDKNTGEKKEVNLYKDGILHGELQKWDQNGKLYLTGSFKKGKKEGRKFGEFGKLG